MSAGPWRRNGRPKTPKGPPITDRERYLADRERQRRALAMWARKVPPAEMARQLGCSTYTANCLVRRAQAYLDVPEAAERRLQMNQALEEEERIAWAIVARPGYKISPSGRVVFEPERDAQGRAVPVVDQATRVAALAHLLRIHDRQARLNGLDEPTKIDVAVGLEAAMAAVLLLEQEADREEAGVVDIEQVALPPGRAVS